MQATVEQVRQALSDFDSRHRNAPEWSGWVDNQAYKYAIFADGKIYPVKQIVSMATGLARSEFSGGNESNDFLSGLGFKIISLRIASWAIKSGTVAIKTLDKSAFTKGTVIPIEIRPFFLEGNIPPGEHRPVTLMLKGKAYPFYIAMGNSPSKMTRLFWSTEFTAELAQRFPAHFQLVQQDNELEGVPPAEMIFSREAGFDRYSISLSEGEAQSAEWTDEELEETVKAYLWMLEQENAGKHYNKSEVNKALRTGKLGRRTKESIEYQMQNISYVLEALCMAKVQCYVPAKNVGSNTKVKIGEMLERLGAYVPEDYKPTSDQETLDKRASRICKKGLKGTPKGQQAPQQTATSTISFVRDPLVKAWTLENAKGICEGCSSPAPFVKSDGEPFLEVHHVKTLADGGADTVENAVALCPNCHRRCHVSSDKETYTVGLYRKIDRLRT
jgi:5-methylcytosine-specific restriction protein A